MILVATAALLLWAVTLICANLWVRLALISYDHRTKIEAVWYRHRTETEFISASRPR